MRCWNAKFWNCKAAMQGVEQRAREQLGLVREGETYYQFVEQTPPARA